MSAINFPDSPSLNETFVVGDKTYEWNGTQWVVKSSTASGVDLSALDQTILPDTNEAYDLGSSTKRFRDVYLSGSSIDLGGAQITSDGSAITLPVGSTVGSTELGSGGATVYATIDDLPLSGVDNGSFALVSATNRLYVWTNSGWYNIALINQTPTITDNEASYQLAIDGTATTVTLTGTDAEGIPITWSAVTSGDTAVATVTNTDNVFTITPSTDLADSGTLTVTFRASDGVNIGTATSEFTLAFLSPLWDETVLSISTSATNGLDNSTFIDRSTNALTVTPTGSPVQTAFHPYLSNWSTEFDGTGDYLTLGATPTDLLPQTSDTTIEAWVKTSSSGDMAIFSNFAAASPFNGIEVGINNGYQTYWSEGTWINRPTASVGTGGINNGQWRHLAWVITNNGTTLTTYIDGVQNYTSSITVSTTGNASQSIGSDSNSSRGRYFNGSISNLRFVKGTAAYTTDFTPSTENLTAASGTSLLTCQSNRFIDSSGVDIKYNFDTSTLVTSLDINPPESLPNGVHFSPDGTRMYIAGDGTNSVHEYSLSTAWAIGTATLTQTFDVSGEEGGINGVFFKPDGTRMYIVGVSGDTVDSYTLSTAWDLSTASYDSASFSVVTQDGTPRDLYIRSDGLRLYIVGDSGNTAEQYTFGTAWDVTSLSHDTTYDLVYEANPSGIFFSEDGLQMFVAGYAGDDITVYSLSTAWDLSTASYVTEYDAVPDLPAVNGIFISPDGKKLFACGTSNDTVYEYSIGRTGNPITVNGTPKISAFNPFGQESEYTVGENKGSMFGDGGKYIDFAGVNCNGDFTVEGWLYSNSVAGTDTYTIFAGHPSSQNTQYTVHSGGAGNIGLILNGTVSVPSTNGNAYLKQWNHLAWTRESGICRCYVNGVLIASATDTDTNNVVGRVGGYRTDGEYTFDGYISDVRVTSGTARYTGSSYTVPTSPLTADGADVYIPMDNAGIFDKTGNNALTLVGNTSTSTTQTKYADTAMYFDGTGDYLEIPASEQFNFGTGDFTIELWAYKNSTSSYLRLFGNQSSSSETNTFNFLYTVDGSDYHFQVGSSLAIETNASIPTNVWHHIACVRQSGVLKIYIDGVEEASASLANDFDTTNNFLIGQTTALYSSRYFNGYIENLQILNGVAKYTANFTPPALEQGITYQAES